MFSPIKLASSDSSQGKNLTGIARHVRDLTADMYANIQQYNELHLQGLNYLKLLISEKQLNGYSEYLQDLCNTLEYVCNNLDDIVTKLGEMKYQLKTVTALQEAPVKLFTNMLTSTFGEKAEIIYQAYYEDAKMKRRILETAAHHQMQCRNLYHLTSWSQQPAISNYITMSLEMLLVGTGLRS